MSSDLYTTTYKPTHLEHFIGNKQAIQPFIKWLLEWDPKNKKTKCALISGVSGVGKSLLVDLILKKHDYNAIHLYTDDDRGRDYISKYIKPVLGVKRTIKDQENVLVVSDIDSGGDYGFISSLVECIKESNIPIICICDNRYDQSIKPLLNYCFDVKLSKPAYTEVYRLLYNVIVSEKIKIKESEVKKLYEESNGDIRFILNSLQLNVKKVCNKKNVQSTNIFDTTGKLFTMDSALDEKLDTYWLGADIHTLMVQENYINNTFNVKHEAKKMENLSNSAGALSDADIFEHAINATHWEFGSFVATSTIQATSACNKKYMIKFSQYFGRISKITKNKKNGVDYNSSDFGIKPVPKNKK
jgi:replication factor C subunit 1